MQRYKSRFRPSTEQREDQHQSRQSRRRSTHLRKRIVANAASKQSEGKQQAQGAETGHHDVDVARPPVIRVMVVRHHQCPRGKRYEFPRDKESEGVVGENDQVHAGKKWRVERQHAPRRYLVLAVAHGKEARRGPPEIDDHKEESGKRIHAEMRADPGQSEFQSEGRRRTIAGEEVRDGRANDNKANGNTRRIHKVRCRRPTSPYAQQRYAEEREDAP